VTVDSNELLLLGLLDREEMHGYRLHEFLDNQLRFVSDLKRPTAYRLLEQLLRRGFVARESEREGRRPERMVYRITAEGRERFVKLLREQLSRAERVIHTGNVALLFCDRIPRDERVTLLKRRLVGVEEQWQALLPIVEAHSPGTAARLALEHDVAHLDVERVWLTQTIDELSKEVSQPPLNCA
jgi:DNA-binding PadR family transcriptional regulator